MTISPTLRSARPRLRISLAKASERTEIYRLRHEVFARELRQHAVRDDGMLRDELDEHNVYLVARSGGRLAGFVSVTPPAAGRYAIDKYVERDTLPFTFDEGLYEVRLLAVAGQYRRAASSGVAWALLYAALRWVEVRGGTHVVVFGRTALLDFYRKIGLCPSGVEVRSGAVTYEVMHATVDALRDTVSARGESLRRLERRLEWVLDEPFRPMPACYHGGAFFDAVGDEFATLQRAGEVINADVLDAWFPPSPNALEALREHMPWLLRTSPPTGCEGLIRTIARLRGVSPANLLCGGGSSDLIYLAFRHWLTPASRVLILDPMYGEYAHVLEKVVGCRVDRLSLARDRDFDVDLYQLGVRLAQEYDLVVLVNPNTPTGRHMPRKRLETTLAATPRGTRLWIDETYIEYVGAEQSLERFAASRTDTVVCKSMSKVYALSGARAAYLCASPELIDDLRPWSPPWAVSLPGQVAAVNALSDPAYYEARYAETHALREDLATSLRDECGLQVVPGVANFLLCELPQDGPNSATVVAACRKHNVYLRDATNMGATSSDWGRHWLRIAVKDAPTNRRIVRVLADALSSLG